MITIINLGGVILLTLLSALALIGLIRMPRRLMMEGIDQSVEVVEDSYDGLEGLDKPSD